MKQNNLQNARSIRFRRWSRAGYAVFCSLACNVTIGSVAGSISDKSLQKAASTTVISISLNNSESESPEEFMAKDNSELVIEQLQEINLPNKTFESAAACGLNTNILFNQNG